MSDISGVRVLGIIGARSGSRSVPDKNIRPLCGKPLFSWIAAAGKASKFVTRVIMSTDSPTYAKLANEYGVETPFLRPDELSGNKVPDFDYLYHAAMWLKENEGWQADIIVRLPPTSPLCTPGHVDACVQLLLDDPTADSSRTITPASKHPYKLWKTEGDHLVPFLSEGFTGLKDAHNLPRQSFPEAFQHVDVIALRWKTLIEQRAMAGERIRYHHIPKEEAMDIDTEVDFQLAEILLRRRFSNAAA